MSEEREWTPGAMWYAPNYDPSPEYIEDWLGKRPPLWVMVPARNTRGELIAFPFSPDGKATGSDHGWRVSGEPPRITVHPSINAIGAYHGWLIDGVLTDGITD